jgi:pyruvate/2-oxoglutarate dehydrogenase complex dihydrolipoamide acyltransferase (E2) component
MPSSQTEDEPDAMTSEETAGESKQKEQLTSQILRERLGGAPKRPMEISREHARIKKQIREALKDGPKTAPQVAESTQLDTSEVFWHLMSMKKYGEVVEGEERDSYVEYTLKSTEQSRS